MSGESKWFEGIAEISCAFSQVRASVENTGSHFLEIAKRMPSLKNVELEEEGKGFVRIRTNEGIMRRFNISCTVGQKKITLEFDEEYEAGKMITAKAHFVEDFIASDAGVTYHLAIYELSAPGILGFFYKKFGSASIGNAFLKATRGYLEAG